MSKIILEVEEFAKTHSEYKVFDQDCIRIGRAFNNDLIINDPFVAAEHITLKLTNGVWNCESLPSLNGSLISSLPESSKRIKVEGSYPIRAGDTIFLGKTSIHIWDPNQPVAGEQALDARSKLLFDPRHTTRSLSFAIGVFGFIYYLYLSQWVWKSDNSFFQVITETFFLSFMLVIWSGLWALITRFTKRQHRFLDHLIFSFHWSVISIGISFISNYVFFFACNQGFEYLASLLIFGPFGVFVLGNHLAIGTNLSSIKRMVISGLIVFSMAFLSVLGYYASRSEFSPDPHHYINISPVPKGLIPSISIHEEVKHLDSIF